MLNSDIQQSKGNMHILQLVTPIAVTKPLNYENLINKPSFNGVVLSGDLTMEDFGLEHVPTAPLTNEEIDNIIGETEEGDTNE